MNFSQQSPKMFKIASESFSHAFLLFLGLFLKIFRWVPLNYLRAVSFILYSRGLAKIPKARRRKRHLKSQRRFIALIPSRSMFQMQVIFFFFFGGGGGG